MNCWYSAKQKNMTSVLLRICHVFAYLECSQPTSCVLSVGKHVNTSVLNSQHRKYFDSGGSSSCRLQVSKVNTVNSLICFLLKLLPNQIYNVSLGRLRYLTSSLLGCTQDFEVIQLTPPTFLLQCTNFTVSNTDTDASASTILEGFSGLASLLLRVLWLLWLDKWLLDPQKSYFPYNLQQSSDEFWNSSAHGLVKQFVKVDFVIHNTASHPTPSDPSAIVCDLIVQHATVWSIFLTFESALSDPLYSRQLYWE